MRAYPNIRPLRPGSPQSATLNGVARALADIYDTPTDEPVPDRIAELLAELDQVANRKDGRD